jgi:hypothetical protein
VCVGNFGVHWGICCETHNAGHNMHFLADCAIICVKSIDGHVTAFQRTTKQQNITITMKKQLSLDIK